MRNWDMQTMHCYRAPLHRMAQWLTPLPGKATLPHRVGKPGASAHHGCAMRQGAPNYLVACC